MVGPVLRRLITADSGVTSKLKNGILTCKHLDLLPHKFVFKQRTVKVRTLADRNEEISSEVEISFEGHVSWHAESTSPVLVLTDTCRATVATKTSQSTTVNSISTDNHGKG